MTCYPAPTVIPCVTYASFIATFPEFSNTTLYPQALIEVWLPIAYQNLNAGRLLQSLPLAVMYYVAHNIVLDARDRQTTANGGIAGQASGPINNKSVDKVSAGYAADLTAIEGAGAWNYTIYGQRLYKLLQGASTMSYLVPRVRSGLGLYGIPFLGGRRRL